ncbi:MAG: isochorismatase family cysteine hydrolase [Desulfatiglandales bacterium]|nr:isochorismatase family cysteine hydrolase [Desulfatiglandales bacterium]
MIFGIKDYMEPQKSAVLVIDMQNDFCHPEGAFGKRGLNLSVIQGMAPRLRQFVETAREQGVAAVHVKTYMDEKFLSPAAIARNKELGRGKGICLQGSWGAEFFEILPAEDEMVITKHTYSAFIDTDLQERLLEKGIQCLMVTGVLTNVCCESTLRDGFMLGFYTALVDDCCAPVDEAAHVATVENVRKYFGWVFKSDDIVEYWKRVRS